MQKIDIPKDIAREIVQAARAGTSPEKGIEYVIVGRLKETKAYVDAFDWVERGGYKVKLIVGEFGSGKTTELRNNRYLARGRGFLTMSAKLTPHMKLYSTSGASLALWKALVDGMDPGLEDVLDAFLDKARAETPEGGDVLATAGGLLGRVRGMNDSDFRKVVLKYCEGGVSRKAAVQWLKGGYNRRDSAREELGKDVQAIISDSNWYSILKCMVQFAVIAGFRGVAVYLDETYNLYKIDDTRVRDKNYEMLHAIVSDNIPHCQLMFTGTPQSLEDRRKGLYSYAPLVSRLETSTEEDEDRVDRYQTVNRIFPLKPEDILMLLVIVKNAYEAGYGREFPVTEQDVLSFVNDYLGSTSLAKYLTARNALLRFTWIMNLMIENPDRSFDECRRRSPVAPARETTDSGQTRIKEL